MKKSPKNGVGKDLSKGSETRHKKIFNQEIIFWVVPLIILLVAIKLGYMYSTRAGISALMTSASIVFTTLWLYGLLPLKEKRKWSHVENEIKSELGFIVKSLFDMTSIYFQERQEILKGIKRKHTNKEYEEIIEKFSNLNGLNLNKMGRDNLSKKILGGIRRKRTEFSNFELKYFRFLKHSEIYYIIRIQRLLFKIENLTNKRISRSFEVPKKRFEKRFEKLIHETYQSMNELRKQKSFN